MSSVRRLRKRPAPSLLEAIADERGRHFFVDTRTCRCGFKPADGGEWIRHGQAAVIIGLCDWFVQVASIKRKGFGARFAQLTVRAVGRITRDRLVKELKDRGQGEEKPWTTGSKRT